MSENTENTEPRNLTTREAAEVLLERRKANTENITPAEEQVTDNQEASAPVEEKEDGLLSDGENNEDQDNTEDGEANNNDEDVFIVKINGKETEVTATQLLETYQKQESAEEKFKQASDIRKTAQARQEEANQILQEYSAELQAIRNAFSEPQITEAEIEKLKVENPNEYINYIEQAAQQQQLVERATQEQQRVNAAIIKKEMNALLTAIPEWQDDEVKKADTARIVKFAESFGFAPEEVNSVVDHRLIVMFKKALDINENHDKPSITKKRRETNGALPSGTGVPRNNATAKSKSEKHIADLENNLKKSGSTRDAAALLLAKRQANVN